MNVTRTIMIGAAGVLLSTPALADGGPFGSKGQISIQGDAQVSFMSMTSSDDSTGTEVKSSMGSLTVAPALDYFIADKISIGGQVGYMRSWSSTEAGGTTTDGPTMGSFVVGPRVGYNVAVSDAISVWPRAGVNFAMGSMDMNGNSSSTTMLALAVDVPVLFHVADHFFVGLAPTFTMDLSAKFSSDAGDGDLPKTTAFGVKSLVGGYF